MPDVAFEQKLQRYFVWVLDAMPDVAFEEKLQVYFAWIADDT